MKRALRGRGDPLYLKINGHSGSFWQPSRKILSSAKRAWFHPFDERMGSEVEIVKGDFNAGEITVVLSDGWQKEENQKVLTRARGPALHK